MMKAPFQGFPPELLAQIAQAAFRPPQGGMGGAPGLSAPQQPQGGGMPGLGAGLGALGASFAGMRGGAPMGADMNTQAPGFGAGLGGSGENVLGDAHKQWLAQNAGDSSVSGYGPSGGGGFGAWWARNFGS